MPLPHFVPLPPRAEFSDTEIAARAAHFFQEMQRRRTVRHFSARPVPKPVMEGRLRAAGTAPSGANLQPWHFVAVSDARLQHEIRVAAEKEEEEFYKHRAPTGWLAALAALGTDAEKPFLVTAPWLIAIFAVPFA